MAKDVRTILARKGDALIKQGKRPETRETVSLDFIDSNILAEILLL